MAQDVRDFWLSWQAEQPTFPSLAIWWDAGKDRLKHLLRAREQWAEEWETSAYFFRQEKVRARRCLVTGSVMLAALLCVLLQLYYVFGSFFTSIYFLPLLFPCRIKTFFLIA